MADGGARTTRGHDGSDLQPNGCNVGQQTMLAERCVTVRDVKLHCNKHHDAVALVT